jgi:hypothetical protein
LEFFNDYPKALRFALNQVRDGKQDVTVIQRREVIHTHENLSNAVLNIHRFDTDENIIEQVHHASYLPSRSLSQRLTDLLRYAPHPGAIVWAAV